MAHLSPSADRDRRPCTFCTNHSHSQFILLHSTQWRIQVWVDRAAPIDLQD